MEPEFPLVVAPLAVIAEGLPANPAPPSLALPMYRGWPATRTSRLTQSSPLPRPRLSTPSTPEGRRACNSRKQTFAPLLLRGLLPLAERSRGFLTLWPDFRAARLRGNRRPAVSQGGWLGPDGRPLASLGERNPHRVERVGPARAEGGRHK